MIEINVTVKCPDLSLAAAALAAAINHKGIAQENPTSPKQPAPTAPASTVSTLPTAASMPATRGVPVTAAPIAPAPAPVPTAAPVYTIDQIAKAGADLAQSGEMTQLLALLQQFGVRAVTEVPPARYGAFATALRGLGAQL